MFLKRVENLERYVRGTGGKNVIFQIPPNPLMSVLNCSTMCQYDILKVLFKKNEWKGSVGLPKLTFLRFGTRSGHEIRIFGIF